MSKKYLVLSLAAIFVIGGFFMASIANAATTSPSDAGTGSDISSVGTVTWLNPDRITDSTGNNMATVTLASPNISHYVTGSDYGFSIPTDATINGIQLTIRRESSTSSSIKDSTVSLMKGGMITGDNKAGASVWSNSVALANYGSASDLWGTTWTPSDINASNFGAALSVTSNSGTNHTGSVDYIQITVTYTLPPKLTVTKVVVNDNGGTKVVADFTIQIDSTTVTSGTENTLTVGAHTISEINDPQYVGATSGDCAADGSITLAVGDVKTCTITNNDIQPKLTVTKVVVNDNGGTKIDTDFALFVGATSVTSGVQTSFNAATYTISETVDVGYAATFSGDCAADGTITLVPADVKTCTIANNDISPILEVAKHMVNDNGGTALASDFTLDVAGPSPLTTSFSVTGSETAILHYVDVGTYIVTETGPAGYELSYTFLGNCDTAGNVSLGLGETKNCTLTNDDISPQLTVKVAINNDNGGSLVDSSTSLTVTGVNVVPSSTFPGDDTTGFTVSLNANTDYDVTAADVTGYTKTFSTDCDGTQAGSGPGPLSLDEARTCTVTFDDIQPKLTVTKIVTNDNSGTKVVADFALFVGATAVSSGVETGFNATNYIVSETADVGYAATFSGDCAADGAIILAVSDVKFCTITNDDIVPVVIITHALTYIAGTNGTITGTTSQTVENASNGTAVTAVANAGFQFVNWSDSSTINPRTETNVITDISVTANFQVNAQGGGGGGGGGGSAQLFTITSSSDANGLVNPVGSLSVAAGNNYTVTITPNAGFAIADVVVDGTSTGAVISHTFINISAGHTILATFAPVIPTPSPEPQTPDAPSEIPVTIASAEEETSDNSVAIAEPENPKVSAPTSQEIPTLIAENAPEITAQINNQTAALQNASGVEALWQWIKNNFMWILAFFGLAWVIYYIFDYEKPTTT